MTSARSSCYLSCPMAAMGILIKFFGLAFSALLP
jgi:hypothetical protein